MAEIASKNGVLVANDIHKDVSGGLKAFSCTTYKNGSHIEDGLFSSETALFASAIIKNDQSLYKDDITVFSARGVPVPHVSFKSYNTIMWLFVILACSFDFISNFIMVFIHVMPILRFSIPLKKWFRLLQELTLLTTGNERYNHTKTHPLNARRGYRRGSLGSVDSNREEMDQEQQAYLDDQIKALQQKWIVNLIGWKHVSIRQKLPLCAFIWIAVAFLIAAYFVGNAGLERYLAVGTYNDASAIGTKFDSETNVIETELHRLSQEILDWKALRTDTTPQGLTNKSNLVNNLEKARKNTQSEGVMIVDWEDKNVAHISTAGAAYLDNDPPKAVMEILNLVKEYNQYVSTGANFNLIEFQKLGVPYVYDVPDNYPEGCGEVEPRCPLISTVFVRLVGAPLFGTDISDGPLGALVLVKALTQKRAASARVTEFLKKGYVGILGFKGGEPFLVQSADMNTDSSWNLFQSNESLRKSIEADQTFDRCKLKLDKAPEETGLLFDMTKSLHRGESPYSAATINGNEMRISLVRAGNVMIAGIKVVRLDDSLMIIRGVSYSDINKLRYTTVILLIINAVLMILLKFVVLIHLHTTSCVHLILANNLLNAALKKKTFILPPEHMRPNHQVLPYPMVSDESSILWFALLLENILMGLTNREVRRLIKVCKKAEISLCKTEKKKNCSQSLFGWEHPVPEPYEFEFTPDAKQSFVSVLLYKSATERKTVTQSLSQNQNYSMIRFDNPRHSIGNLNTDNLNINNNKNNISPRKKSDDDNTDDNLRDIKENKENKDIKHAVDDSVNTLIDREKDDHIKPVSILKDQKEPAPRFSNDDPRRISFNIL
eukprot:GHVR01177209.1.p1 GENE.GHVR01177209.1~~GHVR01177209.1.p1  ORF type:complete len:833 (+),score=185.73 GHVR01177209.1:182-2680(+)